MIASSLSLLLLVVYLLLLVVVELLLLLLLLGDLLLYGDFRILVSVPNIAVRVFSV